MSDLKAKYMEQGAEVAENLRDRLDGCSCEDCLFRAQRIIADALASAHQDGMKQAAEIARKHFDLRHADRARFASNAIAGAILSQVEER